MASRIIHLVLAKKLAYKLGIKDHDKFIVGSLLPDSYQGDKDNHALSHFKQTVEHRKVMNYYDFLERYRDKINTSEVYLGYFLHLVQDAVYRKFLYYDHDLISQYSDDFRMTLYKDYRILNNYLIEKYQLNKLSPSLNKLVPHELLSYASMQFSDFVEDMENDFKFEDGATTYFTEAMVDDYIEQALKVCVEEYNGLLKTKKVSNPMTYSWLRS
jgi:hypothetical protein